MGAYGQDLFATGPTRKERICHDIYGISSRFCHLPGRRRGLWALRFEPLHRGGVRPLAGREIRTRVMARFGANPFELTEVAAAGSRADALLELGLIYCAGREDVAIDLISAHKWFNLAALGGNAEAKGYRMEIAREMSKREIAEAQRQAREWLARH